MIGYIIEAFVFSYLGLTLFSYTDEDWSPQLCIGMLINVMVFRTLSTVAIIKIPEKLFGYKSGLSIKELLFISYAGMIRGAVAFGLVLEINHDIPNRSVIVTTCLFLVIFTTVFMGSTVSTLQWYLFGR